jgi:hypothetical protein
MHARVRKRGTIRAGPYEILGPGGYFEGMVSWTAAPCWTDSMRRTRVNVPSCGEVQKTKYGRPRGSARVQDAGKVGRRGT